MHYRTIIFEDEKPIQDLLRLAAEVRGHEVLTFSCPNICTPARNGLCRRGLVCSDVIISDHLMPDMSGLEFFAILARRRCPIKNKALVTAVHSETVRRRVEELECHFIPKPFRARDIDAWLEKSESNVQAGRELIPREDLITAN